MLIFTAMKPAKVRKGRKWLLAGCLALVIIAIKLFSLDPGRVERLYSSQVYPAIARIYRLLTGWIPFSMGDILYALAAIWILRKLWRFAARLLKRKLGRAWLAHASYQLLIIAMSIYIMFNLAWGINYNRRELSQQLGLRVSRSDTAALPLITELLLQKVNASKEALIRQQAKDPGDAELFNRAVACYRQAENIFPFLNYPVRAVKPSLFGLLGNYFGFTGYYNPFTGEAQVNTLIPRFILPYTTLHEIGHQLGYAKEEEANFAGYLAATGSTDTLFHYSTYLDLFVYANRQLFFADSSAAKKMAEQLSAPVKSDIAAWREFLRKHRNPLEPVIRWAYGNYLRANQQPQGMTNYDEVIADLIGYYKKYKRI